MDRFALLSVYKKDGLEELIRFFVRNGIQLLSTGGTAAHLSALGEEVVSVENYTGSPEILDGRVKTLHPRVHGGILARRSNESDLKSLSSIGAGLIDFVVVNLYPFPEKAAEVKRTGKNSSLIEVIDIGGPTMIRAAAKNFEDVVVLTDPADYPVIIEEYEKQGSISRRTRVRLASKVFALLAAYDAEVARYLSLEEQLVDEKGTPNLLAPFEGFSLGLSQSLRYGENPHQQAVLYKRNTFTQELSLWRQLQGKELSYNNLLDFQAASLLLADLVTAFGERYPAVIVKHLNPCGAAVRESQLEAFKAARACDPVSAFGGIVLLSGEVDGAVAKEVIGGFVEILAAERFTDDAIAVLQTKKNIRVIEYDRERLVSYATSAQVTLRECFNEILIQSSDSAVTGVSASKIGSKRSPNGHETEELEFAWRVCKHVKSNAIVLSKGLQAIGVGAGQMSRVDSARLSIARAREHGFDTTGAVAASDAFLPFPDTLEILADGGVTALIQPGGSIKDSEVQGAADARNMAMLFTGERHFRH